MPDKGTYTAIQDWMLDLGLDIYGVLAFAVIFGFSQDGESAFTGSLAYLARKMCCCRAKAIKTLNMMVEKGYLEKNVRNMNGVKFPEYRVSALYTGGLRGRLGGSLQDRPNNIDIENIDIKECDKRKASPRFVKPSVEEVREYCAARGNSVDAEEFVDFYESKGWMIGKSPMKDWKAAVRTWEKSKNTARSSAPRYNAPRQPESIWEANRRAVENIKRKYANMNADEQ